MRRLVRLAVPLSTLALMLGLIGANMWHATPARATGAMRTYIVLYNANAISGSSLANIQSAGGTLVYSYPQIGVAIVKSDNPAFGGTLGAADTAVQGATATDAFGVGLNDGANTTDATDTVTPNTPAPGSDNLSGLQWDMNQIQAPAAHAITGGSPSVTIGDIDTVTCSLEDVQG
jgi:lantibiotic leader peptide-processing serine protease